MELFMFLQFQKLSNFNTSTPIIVNALEMLTIDFNNFEMNGEIIDQTHIEVGSPKYQFYTLSTIGNIETALSVIDISHGFVPGPPCSGGNSASIVAPQSEFPMIKVQIVNNNTLSEFRYLIINPTKILYAETVSFIDAVTSQMVTAVIIIMNDINRTSFRTTLSFADIVSILHPVIVA
jgi:hypothetical protein